MKYVLVIVSCGDGGQLLAGKRIQSMRFNTRSAADEVAAWFCQDQTILCRIYEDAADWVN